MHAVRANCKCDSAYRNTEARVAPPAEMGRDLAFSRGRESGGSRSATDPLAAG